MPFNDPAPVKPDPRPRGATRRSGNRHMDRAGADRPQIPRRCGAGVAQHGAGAAGKHGRHPASLRGQHRVPDRVDAAVDQMQPTAANAMIDPGDAQPERPQLRSRDHAVLSPGERGDLHVVGDLTADAAV
jgi:hypothetical protein